MSKILQRTKQYLNQIGGQMETDSILVTNVEICDDRYGKGTWKPFHHQAYWGSHDTWYRFRATVTIPEEYAGKRVGCRLNCGRINGGHPLNPQFLLFINGEIRQALDKNHMTFDLCGNAVAGETYALEFEAYAGREACPGASWYHPKFQDEPAQFRLNTYVFHKETEDLFYDLKTAMMAAGMYKEDDYRRIQIETYLEKALNMLDIRVPGSEDFLNSVTRTRQFMAEEFYGKFCREQDVKANCIGHTHIDVAWLWTLEQTRAKAVRSFATELALMEEYPEHHFTSSQPQLYQFVKEEAPELYEKIKERVKEGRWEVEGGMWLEGDCNVTSGESLVRQILHGKRFMKQEFGVDSKLVWLPDVFGYAAALPQIFNKTGIETFITSKISWNDTNHLPVDTFMWKGIDGSEIFTHFITGAVDDSILGDGDKYSTYNSWLSPISLTKGWEMYQQKDINNEILVSFGIGDGGGGVTRDMLEMQRRMAKGIPGMPQSRLTTVTDTLSRIKKNVEGKKIPKWSGELYLELHRATYTSIAKIKRNNRKAEFLLQANEASGLTDKLLLGGNYDKQGIYDNWTTVLLNQFHDIIPGSSIEEVYEDSDKQFAEIFEQGNARMDNALTNLAQNVAQKGIFVYNPSGVKQSGLAVYEGKQYFVKDVPAYGWVVIPEEKDQKPAMTITEKCMENDFFRLELDEKGVFTSIYDKVNNREVLPAGKRGNVLEAYDDHPYQYDNWEICDYYKEKMWEVDDVSEMRIGHCDDVSASLEITRKFLNSTICQTITIYRDIPRVDFDTKVDWQEHHVLLKAAFPVDVVADKATYEIQYGAVERPTHSNTSWDAAKFEVCAHKWVDLGEPDYGVALMNDCKYGHDIHDGVMRLTLIKCGTYPNPNADIGQHQFTYSIMPHGGDWRQAGVVNQAFALNCPLMAKKAQDKGTLPGTYSLVSTDKADVLVTVAKEACDGEEIIFRAYETQGKRSTTTITCGFPVESVQEVDMLETSVYEKLQAEGNTFTADFKPYEIKTFRVSKK